MNIFDLLESPGMGRPRDTKGVQSAADQSAASVIGSGTTEREEKKKPVRMMGKNIKEGFDLGGVKNWLLKLKQGLSTEAEETKAMFDTYVRYTQGQASEQEMNAANEQFKDLLRGLGMGTLAAMPGSVVTLPLVFKLAKKFNIELMPSAFKNDVEEAVVKPNFKMPPESLQDKMYRQHQELRKQRGAPSPEEYKERIAQKQKEIDDLKEGILDRAIPKMPKPRNPADSVLRNKVNAGGRHLDKKRRQELAPKHKHKDPMAESLRPGERHHFETDPVTGKRVYKGIRGDQQDAPQRAKDDPAARADQERKAHIAHDRGLTEQAVKITDYDTWSDEVKSLGGEIHPQKDRNVLVAQSWDGEEIGKFHLGKSMGFINQSGDLDETIRKMGSQYRLLSKKGKNLGTFDSKAGAEKHEREVQYFKHKNMEEGSEDSQEQHVAAMLNRRSRGPQVATHRTLFDLSDEYNSLPAGSTVRHVEGSKKLYVHLVDGSPKNIYRIDKNHVEPLDRTDEGWKGKLAGAALAGAAALGGGDVDAQNIDLPGPQVSYVAHVSAEANGREVHRTMNLGSNYSSEQEAYDDIERSLQAKGITRYNINIEQKYDAQYYPGSNQPRGGSATGRDYGTPGIGDMVIKHIGREIRAGIPSKGGYATGGTNRGERPRDGSQWWRDQLPQIMKEDELAEDIESHLYLMSRAGYDIVQEEWSDKYKDSINCSNPKGFSQKAHCAGKKKNEEVSEEKVRLDPKCWSGKKIGNPKTKMKGGVRVNNCVPK